MVRNSQVATGCDKLAGLGSITKLARKQYSQELSKNPNSQETGTKLARPRIKVILAKPRYSQDLA